MDFQSYSLSISYRISNAVHGEGGGDIFWNSPINFGNSTKDFCSVVDQTVRGHNEIRVIFKRHPFAVTLQFLDRNQVIWNSCPAFVKILIIVDQNTSCNKNIFGSGMWLHFTICAHEFPVSLHT